LSPPSSSDEEDEDHTLSIIRRRSYQCRRRRGTCLATNSAGPSTSTTTKKTNKKQLPSQQGKFYGNCNAVTIELPTCVRGLEFGILPEAKSYRKVHVQRILLWQKQLKETHNGDGLNGHDRDEQSRRILGEQSCISSQRSRRLAQLLANNDAVRYNDYDVDDDASPSDGDAIMMTTTATASGHRPRRPRMIPSWM
jgi:hypothetical protein